MHTFTQYFHMTFAHNIVSFRAIMDRLNNQNKKKLQKDPKRIRNGNYYVESKALQCLYKCIYKLET